MPGIACRQRPVRLDINAGMLFERLVVDVPAMPDAVRCRRPIFWTVNRHQQGKVWPLRAVPVVRRNQVLAEAVKLVERNAHIDGDARFVVEVE